MVHPAKLFGRLGNSMFQYAFLVSYARDFGMDFYFQDEFYFRDHAEAVRLLFSSDIPSPTDAVAIHIRRAGNPIHKSEPKYCENPLYVNLCNTDYYEKAIAMFPNDRFVVFSDDPEWVEKEWKLFDPKRMTISKGKDEIADMNFMASCKAHIIANSTFSWWGAWLSPKYPDNKVVAPKAWFSDGVVRTSLPEHWITI